MTAFSLKIIAIIAMTLNHIAHVFDPVMPDWLYYLCMMPGGLTFPIMAYLMTEGYGYTRNFKRYTVRLFVFALISLLPFFFSMGYQLNVLFTLLLGLLIIYLDDHMQSRFQFSLVLAAAILLSGICDWNFIGVPMILLYHRYKNKPGREIIPLIFMWIMTALMVLASLLVPEVSLNRNVIAQVLYSFIGCTTTIPLLRSYNGQKGRSMKYLFYAYYPAHLAVLALIKHFIL